jgi:hypothetical protein
LAVSVGQESRGKVSLLIYEWQDFEHLGAYDEQTGEVKTIINLNNGPLTVD